eukprot:30726-Eustigmatos_ZCMA.PRE.1
MSSVSVRLCNSLCIFVSVSARDSVPAFLRRHRCCKVVCKCVPASGEVRVLSKWCCTYSPLGLYERAYAWVTSADAK